MRSFGTVAAVLLLALAVGLPGAAAGGGKSPDRHRIEKGFKILDRYNKRLATVYEELQENTRRSNRRARKQCEKLTHDFMNHLIDNSFAPRFFGYTLLFRSIAEYRLGRTRDALWYWEVAQDVLPELSSKKFGNFADAERFLVEHRVGEGPDWGARADVPQLSEAENPQVEEPRKLDTPPPLFPRAAAGNRFSGWVVAECVIRTDGRLEDPVLLMSSGVTTADVAALLALKDWRFQPARLHGKPIPVLYHLTVHFKQPGP
ncbi:MAG: energy transducer TonB [Acidobacteria bacterium]|nr:energy transducer TonB [Acidobacteriota bacterium]